MSEALNQQEPSIPFEDLPDRLRRSRKRMGWDQVDIASRLGVHQRTIANYETGATEPKLGLLMAWAKLTNVPVDWLTYGIEPCPNCGRVGTHDALEGSVRRTCFSENEQVGESEPVEGALLQPDFGRVRENLDHGYFVCTGPGEDAVILRFPDAPTVIR